MATPVIKTKTTRTKKVTAEAEIVVENPSMLSKFVFMDKPLALLEIGLKTEKHIVMYGPGGHGKSELALEFFYEKEINPYIITMGSGLTTDRLFGGINVPVFHEDGKIEYLVENSFMNHEYAIFEEMMDAPDFILEQLKDILSSGVFRNGTQVFPIKTRFIVCCTNKSRDEFSKNIEKQFGKPDVIAGVATGAIGIGTLVAESLGLPFVYVRPEPKKHGRLNQVEGFLQKGQNVIVVEDLISTGNSSLLAVEALRNEGANVKGMVAIFSYGFAIAKENFEKANVNLFTLSNYENLLELAVAKEYITENEQELLQEWSNNPSEWDVVS